MRYPVWSPLDSRSDMYYQLKLATRGSAIDQAFEASDGGDARRGVPDNGRRKGGRRLAGAGLPDRFPRKSIEPRQEEHQGTVATGGCP